MPLNVLAPPVLSQCRTKAQCSQGVSGYGVICPPYRSTCWGLCCVTRKDSKFTSTGELNENIRGNSVQGIIVLVQARIAVRREGR